MCLTWERRLQFGAQPSRDFLLGDVYRSRLQGNRHNKSKKDRDVVEIFFIKEGCFKETNSSVVLSLGIGD